MGVMKGRRIGKRSRVRCGNLCENDGTLDADVNPTDPGSDPTAGDSDTGGGISIEIGLIL